MSRRFQNLKDIPITPENYARLESFAYNIQARTGSIPQEFIDWHNRAVATLDSLPPDRQQAAVYELDQHRGAVAQAQAVTERAVGYNEAQRYFKDASRGIGGNVEGADARKLREIAENKTTVTKTRVPVRGANGSTVADPWTKQTRYETKRTESQKYSDSDARRAALVLAFAKHDSKRAEAGAPMFAKSDGIDPAYLNSPHERTRDVAEAMEQVESQAAIGGPMPTDDYEPESAEA